MKNPIALKKSNFQSVSLKEKEAFITILYTLAAADGKIRPEETDYIKELALEMDISISFENLKPSKSQSIKLASTIKNRRLALELLKNMFALAYTDNTFDDTEGEFILNISEALKIEPEKISAISSWIIDRIIWLEQEELIFEEP